MNGTSTGRQPQMMAPRPAKPNSIPVRPAPVRVPSNYSTSSRQQQTPGRSYVAEHVAAQESYSLKAVTEEHSDEDLGPPEMTEASHGATVRLVLRFQELREVVGMWTDFRDGIPSCDETTWASAYYVNELSRASKFVKRAYIEVQHLRAYGVGTEHPTLLEKELGIMITRIDEWHRNNVRSHAHPDWASQRKATSTDAGAKSSPPTPNMSLVVYTQEDARKSPGSRSESQRSSPPSARSGSSQAEYADNQGQTPSKDDVHAHIRRMIAYMNAITNAVQACRLTRDQMDSGLKNMRQALFKLQKEAIEDMKRDSEQERLVTTGGNLQLARRD